MKFKNKLIFISLIMLVLLSVTCVSATQDLDVNSTLETSDSISEDVISSQESEELEVHSIEVELENNDDVLEADGGDVLGVQAESDDVLEVDEGDSIGNHAENDDVLGAEDVSVVQQIETNADVVLGVSNDDDVLQFPHHLKYILLPTFSGIGNVVKWFQNAYRHDFNLFFFKTLF